MAEKRQFSHHLIREIFEQPDGLQRTIDWYESASPKVRLSSSEVDAESRP